MKIQHLPIFFLSLLFAHFSFAQDWFRPGDKWTYRYGAWAVLGYETIQVGGDTLIEGQACKVLEFSRAYVDQAAPNPDTAYSPVFEYYVYEKDDTVFHYGDEGFEVIYNFNLATGDTISYRDIFNNCDPFQMRLDSLGVLDWPGLNESIEVQYFTVLENFVWIEHQIQIAKGIGIFFGDFEFEPNSYVGAHGYLLPTRTYSCLVDGDTHTFRCFEREDQLFNPYEVDCLELPTSTQEVFLTDIQIYPNPVNEWLYIESEVDQKIEQIRIFSVTGELLFLQNQYNESLDLAGLPKGFYFIHIRRADGIYSSKFAKQ